MKKILLVLSLVLTIGLVGCSSSSSNGYKNVSSSAVQKAIKSSNLLVEMSMDYDIKDFEYFNDVEELIGEGFIIRATMNVRLDPRSLAYLCFIPYNIYYQLKISSVDQ